MPNSGRSAGSFVPFFAAPLTTGVTNQNGLGYKVWLQEQGLDEIDGTSVNAIVSYFETADLSLAVLNNQNRKVKISYIEPDFVQEGDVVTTEQTLGLMEAMKMFSPITLANFNRPDAVLYDVETKFKVERIINTNGQQVSSGDLLYIITPL